MGVLIVHCPNRPKDELIDCGVYGLRTNMASHNVDEIDGELVIGVTLNRGQKLPPADDKGAEYLDKVEAARANLVGAVLGKEVSGIPSDFLPGGIDPGSMQAEVSLESKTESKPSNAPKPAQAKEGGE